MATLETLSIQFNANGTPKAVENIMTMADAVRKFADGLKTLETTKLDAFSSALETLKTNAPNKPQADNMERFADAITKLSTAINGADFTTFSSNVATMGQGVEAMGTKGTKAVRNLAQGLTEAAKEAQAAATSISEAATKSPKGGEMNVSSGSTDKSLMYLVETLERVKVKATGVQGILAKMGVKVPTKQFKSLEEQAEKVAIKYDALRKKIEESLSSGEYTKGSSDYNKKMAELEGIRNEYDRLIQKQKELAQSGDAFKTNPNFAKAYKGVSETIGGLKQAFSGVAGVVKGANKYVDAFLGKITRIGSASKKAKSDTVKFTESIKKLGKEVTRVSKMLKLMITRMALRAVIKEVGNGFKSLALHSQEFDQNMSNLINSSKTLGYSISGMAGQLLNALAPVLLQIIQLVTRAVNALNQLFSALRGLSTWNKAKDFTGSWSDSIKDANKNAKELKKTVLGFDELNQLQDNKSSGGGGGNAITDMFEDVPIDPWFKDLSEKIKKWANKLFEPIKNAWSKVGGWVKEKWKYALDELVKLGKSVARDFWRVWEQPETEQIFKNIFIIVGEIGRAVGNLAKQFRKAWDENHTGFKILMSIRDIILIITNHLRNMATATADWAAKLNFTPLLTSVQKWLASLKPVMDAIMGVLEDFYNKVVLKFTKWVIESGLPALIDVFTRFNQEVKWEELRKKLSELWDHLEPFMETVGEGLIIFIDRVSQKIKDFINGDKFTEFLKFLEDWMDRVTPEDVANAIEKFVEALIGLKVVATAISLLGGAATVIGGIVTACKGMASVVGGVTTLASALGGLGSMLVPLVVIIAAIIAVMYSFVESYGGFDEAMNKVKDVASDLYGKIKDLAEEVGLIPTDWKSSQSAVEELGGAFSNLADALGNAKGLWDALFIVVGSAVQIIATYAIPIIKDLVELIADVTNGIAGMIQAWSGFFDVIIGFFTFDMERVQKGFGELGDGIKQSSSSALETVKDTFKGAGDVFIAPFRTTNEMLYNGGLLDNITGAYDKVGEKNEEAGSLADKLSEKQNNLGVSFDGLKGKLDENTKAHDASTRVYKTHEDVIKNLKKTTDDTTKSFSDSVEQIKKVTQYTEGYQKSTADLENVLKNNKSSLDELKRAVDTVTEANKGMVQYTPEAEKALQDLQGVMENTSATAEETGENIVDGIKVPLTNANFEGESKSLFDNLFGSLCDVFGIASPAKNMNPIGDNIILGVNEGMEKGFKSFDTTFTDFYNNHVKTWFDKDKWSFDGVGEGLKKTFENAKTAIKGVWNGIADKLNGEHEIGSSKIKIDLPKFARGGFPEDGLFMANHHELVGSFSNGKTAVANNSQIISGIQSGVYTAVSQAMQNNSGGSSYISNEILVDGEVIARTITKAQEKQQRRYSPQTV